jgi:hypothetical protein
VIFGDTSKTVEDFASKSATAFGISETAALSAAGTFGGLFQTVGIGADAIDDMSVELIGLAADLASFNNVDPTEALDKLRAGLVGESEPLRALNVFLSEARVKTEAYASGIAQAGEELTDAQKVQARYNIILEDSAAAQGDFARTADGAANQQRILNAEWEDAKARMGEAVLPLFQDLLGVMRGAIPVAEMLAENIGAIGAAFATWMIIAKVGPLVAGAISRVGAASTTAAAPVFIMGKRIEQTTVASGGLTRSLTAGWSALNTWALAAGLVVMAAIELRDYLNMDDEAAKEWTESILSGAASLDDYRKAIKEVAGQEPGLDGGDLKLWSAYKLTVDQVRAAVALQSHELLRGTGLLGKYRTELDSAGTSNVALHGQVVAAMASMADMNIEFTKGEEAAFRQALADDELGQALDILKVKLGLATSFEEDLAGAHRDTAAAAREERAAELQLAGGLLGLIASVDQVQESQAGLAELRRKGKQGTEEYRDAELDLLESQQGLLTSFEQYKTELRDAGLSQDQVKDKLFEMGRQVGLSKDEVRDLIRELGLYGDALDRLPKEKVTNVVTVFSRVGAPGSGPGSAQQLGSAQGGIVRAAHGLIARGPTLLVGEGAYSTPFGRGTEAVLPLDSRGIGILAKALGMALERSGGRGRGDVTFVIQGNVFPRDGREFAEDVTGVLRRQVLKEAH